MDERRKDLLGKLRAKEEQKPRVHEVWENEQPSKSGGCKISSVLQEEPDFRVG